MSNHIHLIISRNKKETLSEIVRDFKKFTSSQIIKSIQEEPESRRNWLLWIFGSAGKRNPNNKSFQVWQQESHPEELFTHEFMMQKLDYLHQNPVRANIVFKAEDYKYSSAAAYGGEWSSIPIAFLY